jgi:hypothetical protein
LLFRKTRIVGLLVSLALFANIVAVNFGFDISVKLFSCFLLLINCVLLWPYLSALADFFLRNRSTWLDRSVERRAGKKNFWQILTRTFIIGLIVFEGLYPSAFQGGLNDDLAKRPYLHGAYQVINDSAGVKRFFIHRDGYFILQFGDDSMKDYQLFIDSTSRKFVLIYYQSRQSEHSYQYQRKDGLLEINFKGHLLRGKQLEWKNLPALNKSIHWFVDDVH